jgi:hypothetical protein
MTLDHSNHRAVSSEESGSPQTSFWRSKAGIVTCGFLLIGGFFLLTEHWAHVLGVLPYLLILACPLMHLFMHRGHGGHGGHHGHQPSKSNPDSGADA